jgi:hypothetical protein
MERIGDANVLSVCISILRLLLSRHQAIAIENAALRLQIAAFQGKTESPAANDRGSVILGLSLRSVADGR